MGSKAQDEDPSHADTEHKNHGRRRDRKNKPAQDEDPSHADTEHKNHGRRDRKNKPAQDEDPSHADQSGTIARYEDPDQVEIPRESYGPPYWKTGEIYEVTSTVKVPRVITLSASVGIIAIIAQFLLGVTGVMALVMGVAVVVSIVTADNHPEYVTLILEQMNKLARKLKVK